LLFLFVLYSHPVYRTCSYLLPAFLRTWLARACLAKCEQQNGRDNSVRARFEIYWQNVVWSRTVHKCAVVSLFCFNTLRNFSASLPRNVDVVAKRWTTSLGLLHRRGRCCWTRIRRQNSSSCYLTSYADEIRFCRSTPEACDSSLTSVWRPGYSRCRLLAAVRLALPFLVIFPLLFRLTLTVVNCMYVCSGHYHTNEL